MIIIYDENEVAYVIRPCPLISITLNTSSDATGNVGATYDIVLTGTIIDHAGSPVYTYNNRANPENGITWSPYYPSGPGSKPPETDVPTTGGLGAILAKQNAISDVISKKCKRIEVMSVEGTDEPVITFYPKLTSINFSEDIWVNKCEYSISFEVPFLLDKEGYLVGSENYATKDFKPGDDGWDPIKGIKADQLIQKTGGLVEEFQETWSIETEDGNGNTTDPFSGAENTTRIYRLTRNITAKGKSLAGGYECFLPDGQNKEIAMPHEQARRRVISYIQDSGRASNQYDDYPTLLNASPGQIPNFASGILNLSSAAYGGYNHSRSENIDISQGTYTVQDTWVLSSGNSYENYSLSLSTSEGEPRRSVNIDGTIKGLTSIPASGSVFGGDHSTTFNTAYENAINKYRQITNSGQFGVAAWTYKRAQNAAGGFTLNPKPLSISIGTNEFTGEITYSIQYDDRPSNLISNASFEGVSVTDTYPGDVFAVIPVIGRPTGPVLQYIGGRTEYQRALSIDLVMENPGSGLSNREQFLRKPSLVEPTRTQIIDAINSVSPAQEIGIRKYFVSPPQETWDPKSGRYSLNITWTYEVNY
jgi:hypothetical protein